MAWLVILEDIHWTRAMRPKLGDAFSPARVFRRRDVPHDFIAVHETCTLESARR